MTHLIRTPYDGLEKQISESSAVSFEVKKDAKGKVINPEVLTKTTQADKEACDINNIVKAAERNGGLILNLRGEPVYGDFTGVGDFLAMKNKVAAVNNAFSLLPAETRDRFANDPAKALEFAADPNNLEEATKLGLVDPALLKARIAADEAKKLADAAAKKAAEGGGAQA